jgi:acetylornithine deacetylase/succinyl-diaminopimelate desuccinylase-like protein
VSLPERIAASRGALEALCRELVRTPSENPPGDTTELAAKVETFLAALPGMQVKRVVAKENVVNLVGRLVFGKPGRRLLMNGHLDTFPAGDPAAWTRACFGGEVVEGRLYGRGACDMKAGIAAALMTAKLLAEAPVGLHGELVLAFVSDEETGGKWGTQYLLENVPEARGDAMLSADAGSPAVVRFGEKGQLWVEVVARGKSNHGAHVHLGENAIVRLMRALETLRGLESLPVLIPAAVMQAMREAQPVSEAISGKGEFHTLSNVTVNVGTISGGIAVNIIPDSATARADIRFPPGLALADILREIDSRLGALPGVAWSALSSHEPNVTDPTQEIVRLVVEHARSVTGRTVVANMRPGFSDSRFYRAAGIPSVVYGPAPNNMGGGDESVLLEDLYAVFAVHARVAAAYLAAR